MAVGPETNFNEWWDRSVDIVTLIGLTITAWATARLWGSQRHQDAARKPTVTLDSRTLLRAGAEPSVLSFSLDKDYRSVWQIEAISVRWPPFTRVLSPFSNPTRDATGDVHYTPAQPYRTSVSFEGNSASAHVFVVPGSTRRSLLMTFTMSMRASPRIKSRFPVRINIQD